MNRYKKRIESFRRDCEKIHEINPKDLSNNSCAAPQVLKEIEHKLKQIEHKTAIHILMHNWEMRNVENENDLIVKEGANKIKEMEAVAKQDMEFGFDFNKLDDDKAILEKLKVF